MKRSNDEEETERRLGNVSSETVFETLRMLSRAARPLAVADIHRQLDEPITSAHRAIATLQTTGFATHYRGSNKLAPGAMCYNLVRALVNRYTLRRLARPYLERLVEVSEGAATLNARLGWYSIRIASSEGRTEYFQQRRIGEARPLHEFVAPITILAGLTDADLAIYRRFMRAKHPELAAAAASRTVRGAIERLRLDGYLRHPDPERPGWNWVGFPFHGADGKVVAAVTVSAPIEQTQAPDSPIIAEARATVRSFEKEAAATPDHGAAPFAHLSHDTIVLRLQNEPVEQST